MSVADYQAFLGAFLRWLRERPEQDGQLRAFFATGRIPDDDHPWIAAFRHPNGPVVYVAFHTAAFHSPHGERTTKVIAVEFRAQANVRSWPGEYDARRRMWFVETVWGQGQEQSTYDALPRQDFRDHYFPWCRQNLAIAFRALT
jgi:hypothetical protein